MITLLFVHAILSIGQEAPAPSRVWSSEEVSYLERPQPEFPMRARTNRGSVVLICTVTDRGFFTRCQVESETPGGNGFGRAAIASMRHAQIAMPAGGPAEGDRVRGTIAFWNGQ